MNQLIASILIYKYNFLVHVKKNCTVVQRTSLDNAPCFYAMRLFLKVFLHVIPSQIACDCAYESSFCLPNALL